MSVGVTAELRRILRERRIVDELVELRAEKYLEENEAVSIREAVDWAEAYARNEREQRRRAVSHRTGCTPAEARLGVRSS